jgi:uncharacterized beta-barrel protein YwiB (DUF1934 family)
MLKDVIIYITGLQYAQSERGPEDVQLIAPGEYYFKNGSHYLVYDEVGDGPDEKYKNIIKFKPEYLEVTKKGQYNTKLVFETNKKTLSQYETPMGLMYIGISTKSVKLKEEPDLIELKADYTMDINNNFIADCSVSLTAKSRESGIDLKN